MKKFDVAIARGGVIEGAIALELARAGLRVAVYDRQHPGQEASWASAGILSPAPENPGMVAMVPLGKASLALYPEFVAQVEEVFSGNGAKAMWREKNRCAGLVLQNERVAAQWTIIAAGCFSVTIEGIAPYAPVRPAKGQMAALRADDLKMERVLWSEKIYLVPRNDGRIVAGATVEYAGFDKRTTAGGIEKILSAAIDLAPGLKDARIEETWAGLRPDSADHLPILGPTDLEGLLMATGHFRSGILLTPVTARLVREWITEQKVSVDCERFSPQRFQSAAAGPSHRAPA